MTLAPLIASTAGPYFYVGTYTRSISRGIYRVHLDAQTGALGQPELVAETANPTFLAFAPDQRHLYSVSETPAMAEAFAVEPETGRLNARQPPGGGGRASTHLAVDKSSRCLVVAHYGAGKVAAISLLSDGSIGPLGSVIQHQGNGVHPTRQEAAHAHSVTISPDNRLVFVCDLGLDRVFIYRLDAAAATLTPAAPAFIAAEPGAGPRHSAFTPDGRHFLVLNELNNTLVVHAGDAAEDAFTITDSQSTLPADYAGESTAAEVRVHPNGRFVYASNRGHDSIAVFALDPATGRLTARGHVASGGRTPRNFSLSPDGMWLVAANQDSDNLVAFSVDPATGKLTPTGGTATVGMPVCVLFPR